jgi:hypothetical protein
MAQIGNFARFLYQVLTVEERDQIFHDFKSKWNKRKQDFDNY